MFKTLAHPPALARATAGYLKALLSDGALAGWYKELISARMSVLNGSEYAVSAHALSARQKGASEEQIAAVKSDFEQDPFTQAEKLGLRCAGKIHRTGRDFDHSSFAALINAYN